MKLIKVAGLLLEYPDEALWQHQAELRALITEQHPALLPFIEHYFASPPLDIQAEWCALFEHVHAESRDRAQAMVDLLAQYERAGLELNCRELPDYLPLYLCGVPQPAARRRGAAGPARYRADSGAARRPPEGARQRRQHAARCAAQRGGKPAQ